MLLGGQARDGAGFFYEPTVLVDVPPNAPVFREETFGPVAAIVRARDADDAIEHRERFALRPRRGRVDE